MTLNEAREFISRDSENWILIEQTEHVLVYRLRFKDLTYYRIDVIRELPDLDAPRRLGFALPTKDAPDRGVLYYESGEREGRFGQSVSKSYIAREIHGASQRR